METYLERIVAAVKARQNPDFVIIARTDARNAAQFGGPNAGEEAFQEGVKRCVACSADCNLTHRWVRQIKGSARRRSRRRVHGESADDERRRETCPSTGAASCHDQRPPERPHG